MIRSDSEAPGLCNSARRPVLFTDLDDTLFQTARKITEPVCESHLAAEATNGHHSYMTESQASMTQWLLESTRMVPVTARSTDALSRCRIPFKNWKVAANGAVILNPEDHADSEWSRHITQISKASHTTLETLDALTCSHNTDGRFRHWIVREEGRPVYFCVKSNGEEAWLDDLREPLCSITGEEFLYHRNGNNMSFTPRGISKMAAVAHLIDRNPEIRDGVIIAMGDSLTDLPFMGLADMMMIPPGSQLDTAIRRG
ncbi:hypothetical protein [Halomonas sp. 11-S5]|uniref:hypothetical protein n=1 Tax=Halomonas sp. 11-S5 TaxID=2994064 RepID=UPI0024694AE6|nr:hypothetical protein [Halomonas sp. 11-S5]